jgi:hypothetical protein
VRRGSNPLGFWISFSSVACPYAVWDRPTVLIGPTIRPYQPAPIGKPLLGWFTPSLWHHLARRQPQQLPFGAACPAASRSTRRPGSPAGSPATRSFGPTPAAAAGRYWARILPERPGGGWPAPIDLEASGDLPAASVVPITRRAGAPVTLAAAARRPRDTQPPRTTPAPTIQPRIAGWASTSRAQAGQQVPGGQEGGGAGGLVPVRLLEGARARGSCGTPRRKKNDLMGSVVSRVLAALVERVNGGPEGVAGPAGRPDSRGESPGHPLGGRNDLMVGAGAGGL